MNKLFVGILLLILLAACENETQQSGSVSTLPTKLEDSGIDQSLETVKNRPLEIVDSKENITQYSPFESSETPLEQGDLTRAADAIEKLTGRRRETEKVARFGTIIYVYAAPDLFEYDLETDRVEIVCTGEISYLSDLLPFENMEVEYDAPLLYLSPDVAFYAVGTDIYRCHIPSRTSERVYQNDRLISFEPISNNTLLITLPNPEWEAAVMETGERSNGLPEYTIFQYHIAEKRTEAYEPPFPPEK